MYIGIVNAAKVLNLTPSAISQSIQKLRVIFLTHCLFAKARVSLLPHLRCIYMSISVRALSPFLARWISKGYDKQRTITVATTPSVGALFLPVIYRAIKTHYRSFYCASPYQRRGKPTQSVSNQISSSITCLHQSCGATSYFCSPTIWC